MWRTWLEAKELCQIVKFVSTLRERLFRELPAKHFVWQKDKVLYQILYLHYTYPHYPRNVRSAFQRENLNKNTWELEIIIPTIIYIFSLGFLLLLLLHLYLLERFLTQILTTPNMSVESSFGAFGKHWKEPLSGGCNRAKLWDSGKLVKTWLQEVRW